MRIGYKASAEQFGPRELLEYAVLAEAVGLDSVWVSDHVQPWRHEGGHGPFSLAWLAAVGERTERVQLGTSVLTPTFRYPPGVVAHAFGTLGVLYPGRIALGVGTGEALNEVALGTVGQWPDFKERFARLREAVGLIRTLWTQERVSFQGEYYRTTDATIYDRPQVPVPIYVAAGGPLVARYAGRTADGFICTSGKGAALYRDQLVPAVQEGLDKAGRSGADVDRMIEIKLSYDRDRASAVANCRFWAALSLTAEQKHGTTDPVEMQRLGDELSDEQVASRWIVSDSPDEVLELLRPYVDWGFTHLVFHGPGHDQKRFLHSFAEDLLPRLRELG
ncbi:MAG: glucose-6-phosphate dehydrogenase (coenzyme-F420) [Dermatophilaceae bacterium]